jgi:hypothetical protein
MSSASPLHLKEPTSIATTFAAGQVPMGDICSAANFTLFDHLVGEREQLVRHVEAKGFRGFEVDRQRRRP